MESSELDSAFHAAMLSIYERALSECNYKATRFLQMLHRHGGVQAAKLLLQAPHLSDGLTELWRLGRLDLSMEALVLDPRWRSLFTELELATARKSLADLGYCAGQAISKSTLERL